MEGNPQYDKKRWVHFGACALNAFLVLTTVIVLSNSNDYLFTEYKFNSTTYVLVYLIIFIGIECIGMFGAYFEHSSLTITYICVYIIKLIDIFVLLNDWGYILCIAFFFYVVSFITSIVFLASLSDELQRRQYNASPQVLPLQSTFPSLREQSPIQSLPRQSTKHELLQQPLPLHQHYHPALPLTDDRSPSQVINVMEMTATTKSPEKPTLSNNE